MRERLRDAALDRVDGRRRRVARIDAAEHDQPVAVGLQDRRIVVAARELDGEARDARLHQPVEQLRIGVVVLQRGAARIAVAEVHDASARVTPSRQRSSARAP